MTTLAPSLPLIRSTFANEVTRHGGSVRETFEQDDVLIMRATLPKADDVRPGDTMESGVALKCHGVELDVHPYTFRQVCSNGAILAQSTASHRLHRCDELRTSDVSDVLIDLVETINTCADGQPFAREMNQLRAAAAAPGSMDMLLNLLPMLPTLSDQPLVMRQIMTHYVHGADESVFGIMNAITATARDESDPGLKWDLEELGGGVPARLLQTPSPDTSRQPV